MISPSNSGSMVDHALPYAAAATSSSPPARPFRRSSSSSRDSASLKDLENLRERKALIRDMDSLIRAMECTLSQEREREGFVVLQRESYNCEKKRERKRN